jgi:hypothetical protein
MDRTANRNAISIAALPINMMPMNDEEEAIFAKYKNAFYNL